MKLLKSIMLLFNPTKRRMVNFKKARDFYRFVQNNHKTKTYEEAMRLYFQPLIVPVETLEAYREVWDVSVASMSGGISQVEKVLCEKIKGIEDERNN